MKSKNLFLVLYIIVLCLIPAKGFTEQLQPKTEAEAQFVRRIIEFWKDEEHLLVRSQIKQFSQDYPKSTFLDNLWLLLGDLEYSHECYQDAVFAYDLIKSPDLSEKSILKKLDSLYQLQKWSQISDTAKLYLPQKIEETFQRSHGESIAFFYAEALHNQAKKLCLVNKKYSSQAKELDESAKRYYELLLNSSHREKATLRLAEIHMALDNQKRAAELYFSLTKENPSLVSQEDLLFQAANLQASENPERAIEIFSQVIELKGERAEEALKNKIFLLFASKKHELIVQSREQIALAKNPQLDFLVVKSLCALHRYQEALNELTPYLGCHDKMILLTAITCAYHVNDSEKVEKCLSLFEKQYSSDSDYAKALYYQFLTYQENEKFVEAQKILSKILNSFPEYQNNSSLHFDNHCLLFKQQRWSECRQAFRMFIAMFPNDDFCSDASSYIISASWKEIEQQTDPEKKEVIYQELLKDIHFAIKREGEKDTEQKRVFLFQLAKAYYSNQEYANAIAILNNLSSFDANEYQIRLLLAMSYRMGSDDLEAFIVHAEKALKIQPHGKEQAQLHHHLFSAFLVLAKQEQGNEKQKQLLEIAADNLFLAMKQIDLCTNSQLIWLGRYYHQIVSESTHEEIAISKLENLVLIDISKRASSAFQAAFAKDKSNIAQDQFKLSNLYGWQGQSVNQIALLESLKKEHCSDPTSSLSLRVFFSLAMAHESSGNATKALSLFQNIIENGKGSDGYFVQVSKLHYSRLAFAHLNSKTLDNPEACAILNYLKDIQIHKIFSQEPLHLEAAIDYAFFRSSLESPGGQEKQLIHLLIRAKEEFTSNEGIWSKNYQECRKRMPEKEYTYQAYLMLIDAHIARAEAKLALMQENESENQLKNETASILYQKIREGKFAVSKYIVDQAAL